MLKQIVIVILLLLAAAFVCFMVPCVKSIFQKIISYPVSSEKHRIAVLIPARNEEKVIGNLIQSLMKQKYPKDRYKVFVLINHCTDGTKECALANGAEVLCMEDDVATKGDVLERAFSKLKSQGFDAYIILDADNLADSEFLTRMNDVYSAGYPLVQGRRTGKNKECSVVSRCYEVFYVLQNMYFNHARTVMGKSASINGTALLIAQSYLDAYGYKMYTLTEDLEMMAVAALNEVKIGYAHEAVVYDEYPTTWKMSYLQLKRWIFGQIQCMRRYVGRLVKKAVVDLNSPSFDIVFIFVMPVMVITAAILIVIWLVNVPAAASFVGKNILWILLVIYGAMIAMLSAAVKKNGYHLKEYLAGILCFPMFVGIWLVVMPQMLFRKKLEWAPIAHDTTDRIEDMK